MPGICIKLPVGKVDRFLESFEAFEKRKQADFLIVREIIQSFYRTSGSHVAIHCQIIRGFIAAYKLCAGKIG